MPTYLVSSADGSDLSSGLTLDLTWATLEHAYESGGLAAGDDIIIRRTHSETPGSDIAVAYTGTITNPIRIAGLHRVAFSITSATWTNGSTTVDIVLPATITKGRHLARYIDAPDGERYLITDVIDGNTFIIDREYAGTTVTLLDGASTIQADPVIAAWTAYDDSADTIKKANWEADDDSAPQIDFNDQNFDLYFNNAKSYFTHNNIEFLDSADANGIIQIYFSKELLFEGCLFTQNANNSPIFYARSSNFKLKRFVIEGSGAGASQRGIVLNDGVTFDLIDGAIHNCGDNGIFADSAGFGYMDNINLGVENANGDADINVVHEMKIDSNDVKLGGSNGTVVFGSLSYSPNTKLTFENYGKILSEQRTYYVGGYFERVAVAGENPNKKTSDYVLKVIPNVNLVPTEDFAIEVPLGNAYDLTAVEHTITVYIYNDTGVTLNDVTAQDNIWIKAKYLSSYDDTSEYTYTELLSAQIDILDAVDADAWIALTATFTPAVAGKVFLSAYMRLYSAAGNIFVEPAKAFS